MEHKINLPNKAQKLGLFAALSLIYFAALALGFDMLSLVIKPLPVLLLWWWLRSQENAFARWIGLGFLASSAGDLFMALPPSYLLFGMGAFALAHLAYMVAFYQKEGRPMRARAVPFLLYGLLVYLWLKPGMGELLPAVCGYMLIICSMLWRASTLLGENHGLYGRLAFAGAVTFAISDTVIAMGLFATPLPAAQFIIMILYWSAQLTLFASATIDQA